ncbi:MAG: lysophospholipid acyltransferase family protein [Faecalimonas sp.]|nr:lysophospholipid acyltransferase family protein [Faecalimonas sp.]
MSKKKKKWIYPRHQVVRNLLYLVMYPYCRLKFGVKIERMKDQQNRPYLILLNHQMVFDQFFVGMAFKGPIYYVATEDIFSLGWVSTVIRYLIAPIPIKKQTTDVQAVRTCYKVAKEGGTIAIAPEGNRTYSGKTEYMNPAIAALARTLNLPIAFFRIEGGYGVQPRWCDKVRRGKMRAYFSRVVMPEEYKEWSNDELYQVIQKELYVNEAKVTTNYYHRKNAEFLERLFYVCPHCGLSIFESHGDKVACKTCNREYQYLATKELKGVGFDSQFRFVNDWYEYQKDFVNKLDINEYIEQPMYSEQASFSEVIVYKNKKLIQENAVVELYGDRILIDGNVFPFTEITAASVLGRNKLNIYHDKKVYQLKGNKRFNAIKYVHMYYRYKNVSRGEEHEQFLGL